MTIVLTIYVIQAAEAGNIYYNTNYKLATLMF